MNNSLTPDYASTLTGCYLTLDTQTEAMTDTELSSQPEPEIKEEIQPLTDAQRARIERNRQRALLLKQARLASRPYQVPDKEGKRTTERVKVPGKVVDTKGGFLLEEEELGSEVQDTPVVHPPGAILGPKELICEECDKEFVDSILYRQYEALVCDNCRDTEDKHRLITKTEAKNTYLLKDADFDRREPPLKSIVKKNPHNPRWGDMKLYLECQVAERSLEVWGSEENMEEERNRRIEAREKVKQKKFDKKVKALRMAVRSSLWKKDTSTHEHEYGEETYDEDEDMYSKQCTTCGHTVSYEKM